MVLTNIPNHYRIPLFNELARQLNDDETPLVVLFAAESYERRRGRETRLEDAAFDWHILSSTAFGKHRPIFLPRGVNDLVATHDPSVFIAAGTGSLALAASRAARKHQKPLVIWSGEIERGSRLAALLKRPLKRSLLKRASALVSYGTASADFLRSLVPGKAIFPAWNTADLEPFLSIARTRRGGQVVKVVTVGDLVEVKGYAALLRAMSAISPELKSRFELAVVGDGSERDRLLALTQELGLSDQVRFLGRKKSDEIPEVLAQSDLFVFSSLADVWGLALLEAMAAGLPVIASSRAGATRDLVVAGTGLVVDPLDVENFSKAFASIASMSQDDRIVMGLRARAHVARLCSLENSAGGFISAIRHSRESTPLA